MQGRRHQVFVHTKEILVCVVGVHVHFLPILSETRDSRDYRLIDGADNNQVKSDENREELSCDFYKGW